MNYPVRTISLPVGPLRLHARLSRPENARALVMLAHTGADPVDQSLAVALTGREMAVMAVDMLTPQETRFHSDDDTARLAQRMVAALDFIRRDGDTEDLAVGLFARDHGSAAAIRAAAQRDAQVGAVVVRGGLIDHAGIQYLEALMAPLLVIPMAETALEEIAAQRAFAHLSAVHEIARIDTQDLAFRAGAWFAQWLR